MGRGFYRLFTSLRTTLVLLVVLSILLLLNVVLPQEGVTDAAAYDALIRRDRLARIALVGLGLGRVPTSPPFLAVTGLFLLNLVAVLVDRMGSVLRRVRLRPPSPEALARRLEAKTALVRPLPEGLTQQTAAEVLRGFGYRVVRVGEQALWGVRNRHAAVGFLLFHASFLVLFAGGAALWATRLVGTAVLTEGQPFDPERVTVSRTPPYGRPDIPPFTLVSVEPRFEGPHTVHLGATLRLERPGGAETQTARVNHPVTWGATSLLVERAGLAPILWLQDARGFTLDRVAVAAPTRETAPTDVDLAEGRVVVTLKPLGPGATFPGREALATFPVELTVTRDDRIVYEGALRPGQSVAAGDDRLVLEGLRYWAGLRIVSERGGALLIAGFLLAVVGLVWRQLWYRREVMLTLRDGRLLLGGRTEYFPWRFREELEAVASVLSEAARTTKEAA